MATKTLSTDFNCEYAGRFGYFIKYTSPKTGKVWVTLTTDPVAIGIAKAPNPDQKALNELKRFVKANCLYTGQTIEE
jgi:hypothetical protein